MRPYLLHRVLEATTGRDHDEDVAIAVFVPAVLSIKPVPVPGEGAEA
jgi:hypothetical protein